MFLSRDDRFWALRGSWNIDCLNVFLSLPNLNLDGVIRSHVFEISQFDGSIDEKIREMKRFVVKGVMLERQRY